MHQVTAPEGSRQMARRARSKDKSLELYEGALHDLLHDGPVAAQVAARITAAVTGWLSKKG